MPEDTLKNEGLQLISRYRTPLMGLAALFIYEYHEWQPLFGASASLLGEIENFVVVTGFFGVDIFFFLSGMGLVYAIGKHSLPVFYLNRLKRIFFPFLLVACGRAVVEKWSLTDFLRNITGINFYLVNIYSYMWFVVAICTLYLLFPLYYKAFSAAGSKTAFTVGVILGLLLASLLLQGVIREDLFGAINRLPIFLVGVLIGELQKKKQLRFYPSTWVAWVLCLLVGLTLAERTNFEQMPLLVPLPNCYLPTFLMALACAFLCPKLFYELDKRTGKVGKILLKFLSFYGGISLEFYCVQQFIGYHMVRLADGRIPNVWLNPLLFGVITLAAMALRQISRWGILGIEKAAAQVQKH